MFPEDDKRPKEVVSGHHASLMFLACKGIGIIVSLFINAELRNFAKISTVCSISIALFRRIFFLIILKIMIISLRKGGFHVSVLP